MDTFCYARRFRSNIDNSHIEVITTLATPNACKPRIIALHSEVQCCLCCAPARRRQTEMRVSPFFTPTIVRAEYFKASEHKTLKSRRIETIFALARAGKRSNTDFVFTLFRYTASTGMFSEFNYGLRSTIRMICVCAKDVSLVSGFEATTKTIRSVGAPCVFPLYFGPRERLSSSFT